MSDAATRPVSSSSSSSQSQSQSLSSSPFILDATSETFAAEVIERSKTVPVVVDFWAAWCQPCRMLAPVLEKLAREYDGRFILVKVDTDRSPEISASLGVRSLPSVFGVRDGEILDAFAGVQPEAVIRQWIDRLLPSEAEALAAEAARLERTDRKGAEAKYAQALSLDPELSKARVGLARIALADGRTDEAAAAIAELERQGFLDAEAEKLKAEIVLSEGAESVGDVASTRAALAEKPDDLTRKFELAEALAAIGEYDEALGLCLDLVERDRKGVGEQARQTMLAIFQLLPPDSPLATDYRRRLSFVL